VTRALEEPSSFIFTFQEICQPYGANLSLFLAFEEQRIIPVTERFVPLVEFVGRSDDEWTNASINAQLDQFEGSPRLEAAMDADHQGTLALAIIPRDRD